VRARDTGVWAVVPVKGFARGKSRLAEVLSPAEREQLARDFCDHVLGVVDASEAFAGVLVLTDCDEVAGVVGERGAEVMRDACDGPLGALVDAALASLAGRGARGAVVLMSDLPLLTPEEVRRMVAGLAAAPLVLAPDRRDEGTNALAIAPPDRMPTCFGHRDSFARHAERARASALEVTVERSDGLACDVDSPEDLAIAQACRGARGKWNRNRASRVSAA
jgi:2-phospho-L-lactate guanylyltransferase